MPAVCWPPIHRKLAAVFFYEQYADEAALDFHRNTPYFKEYVTGGLDGLMESRARELAVPVE